MGYIKYFIYTASKTIKIKININYGANNEFKTKADPKFCANNEFKTL